MQIKYSANRKQPSLPLRSCASPPSFFPIFDSHPKQKLMIKRIAIILFGIILWFLPHPEAIDPQAWHLFAIFITAIFAVVFNVFHVLLSSVFALVVTILTGVLEPADAFSGFSNSIILLIIIAFLIAKAVVKSGLGERIALLIIRRFGHTTLGLGYSLIAADFVISPAFPSNTARSGLLFPVVLSVAKANGSEPDMPERKKTGAFLMFVSMFGIGLSSAMFLTAMAANPAGAEMAKEFGVNITFGNWALAAFVPTIASGIIIPWAIYKMYPPDVKLTPEAPEFARNLLHDKGPMSRDEWITAGVFVLLVVSWAVSDHFVLDKTAIAFLGLGLLMVTGVFTPTDMKKEGEALSTMIWFAILFTLSTYLNELGFMGYVGNELADAISGFSWPVAFVILILTYVLIHYLFVSQTAHLLALFGVFMGAGVSLGVPPVLMAFMLLFATNFFSVITPQGSSHNILYLSSGYMDLRDVYLHGGINTFIAFLIYITLGTAWILLVF
jgi:DASS family divalent anion:Na+ symporter